ncbi:hypothetical protein KIJ96_02200 [Pseudoalteromonas piscicida]|uniref:hypothetical protein n=1 Tax=Pseudoalteromonas piscicida TaxID=43662 RepID=UPI001D0A1399|nr:hypothetical protein [Pseudoalteromonas piscicida]UDM62092.1 hypothetical protein KIJ96_02200 [Pseudoalteromonas piscicida]
MEPHSLNQAAKDLVKVEAVNIYQTLSYSQNLSVYRGLSLRMRQAIFDVIDALGDELGLQVVSNGASTGVFSCKEQEHACTRIKAYLETYYQGFTFTVTGISAVHYSNYRDALERLIQQGREAQLGQTAISVLETSETSNICQLSHILPADTTVNVQGQQDVAVNPFIKSAFEFGKEQKQQFYNNELNIIGATCRITKFAENFEQIALKTKYKMLEGKLAYVYFDGNKFSRIQNIVAQSVEAQIEFDKFLQTKRAQLLEKILEWVAKDADFNEHKALGGARFETLLWGGDECFFVMPASKGFEFIAKVNEWTQNWKFKDYPLTHAFGLVFCHMKNLIQKIRALAYELAESVKDNLVNNAPIPTDEGSRKHIKGLGNGFQYMVLESIDTPEQCLAEHYKICYGHLAPERARHFSQSVASEEIKKLASNLEKLGKSQAYQTAKVAISALQDKDKLSKQLERMQLVSELSSDGFTHIYDTAGLLLLGAKLSDSEDHTLKGLLWVLITESWEYLVLSDREVA